MSPPSPFVRALPKVQLHCHLEGTVRAETFRELAALRGVSSTRADGPLEATYAFADFRAFLLTFAEVCKTLARPDDFARIASDYAEDAANQGVRYAEIFISPSVWTFFHAELDTFETVRAIRAALDSARRAGGPDVALICDLTRNFGVERAFETARVAVRLAEADLGVVGIGLGGDETNFPAALYREPFAFARAAGLHAVAHAGEAAGPESIRDALDVLGAERIGHGVRAVDDPSLVASLAARGTTLEICPTSNRLTGATAAYAEHPLVALDAAHVRCALDADDPALFSTTLCDEYAFAEARLGTSGVLRLARNAIDGSFASRERQKALHAELDAFAVRSGGLENATP